MSPNRYYTPKHQYIRNLSRIKWDTSSVHNLRPIILWYKYTGYLFTEGNIRNVLYPIFAKNSIVWQIIDKYLISSLFIGTHRIYFTRSFRKRK